MVVLLSIGFSFACLLACVMAHMMAKSARLALKMSENALTNQRLYLAALEPCSCVSGGTITDERLTL